MSEKKLPIAEGEVLQECIKTYGASAQIDLAIEEMSELIKALLKERRAVRKNDTEAYNLSLVNVAEEMADTIIMLTQLTLIFKNQEKVEKFINFKLKREKLRLEEFEKINKIASAIFEAVDNYKWEENQDGGITIIYYTGNGGDVVIPSEIGGKSVTSIDVFAFDGCTGLTSVTIPGSVTKIGNWAFFRCTGLTDVKISDSVTEIGMAAFSGCKGLTSVTIPDSVTSIGDCAFDGRTELTSVTIPDSVTSIGDCAFDGCTGLTSVTIPDSVTSIGYGAFFGCTGLTGITIPDSVTDIGMGAFFGCTGLTSIDVDKNNENYLSEGGIVFNKDKSVLVLYPVGRQGAYNIPSGVAEIGNDAFLGRTELTSVTISDSVTSISYLAFYNCKKLTDITIPASVIKIGREAFYGCDNITIHGYKNSYAETYANKNGITFVAIDAENK